MGTARTAIFNWLFARQHGGSFILRIEDTDRERSRREFEDSITHGLRWLGLEWDEGPDGNHGKEKGKYGPYRQSERVEIYEKSLERLLREGRAYYCYCTKEELEAERQGLLAEGLPPRYSGHCREQKTPPHGKSPQVIRFRMPEGIVEVKDLIRGTVSFDMNLIGDIVIAKDIHTPLYNFAVAVDDEEMKISHVIRGEDHLSNTPKQIVIQRALGFLEPVYAHLPLILSGARAKLSKRDMETSLLDYKARGYLPEAMVNFLALLGWHPTDNKEVFTQDELLAKFNLKRVQKSGAVWSGEKLDWVNGEHIKSLKPKELVKRIREFAKEEKRTVADSASFEKIATLEQGRLARLADFFDLADFFFSLPEYEAGLLAWQNDTPEKTQHTLEESLSILRAIPQKKFLRDTIEHALGELIAREGRGSVLWPLRAALSGKKASPDPLDIMEILGHDETTRRISSAIEKLK